MYYSLYKDIKGLIAEKFGILLDPQTGIVSDARTAALRTYNGSITNTKG